MEGQNEYFLIFRDLHAEFLVWLLLSYGLEVEPADYVFDCYFGISHLLWYPDALETLSWTYKWFGK